MNSPLSLPDPSLHSILEMSTTELAAAWHQTFRHPPPVKCGKDLMRGALSWHLQAKAFGGLTSAEFKALRQPASSRSLALSVGSRLVRVWQGNTYQVTVLENGFDHDEKHWTSLSAIARVITGTPWSGPVFFWVKK